MARRRRWSSLEDVADALFGGPDYPRTDRLSGHCLARGVAALKRIRREVALLAFRPPPMDSNAASGETLPGALSRILGADQLVSRTRRTPAWMYSTVWTSRMRLRR